MCNLFYSAFQHLLRKIKRLKQLHADILSANNTPIGFSAFTPETNATQSLPSNEMSFNLANSDLWAELQVHRRAFGDGP